MAITIEKKIKAKKKPLFTPREDRKLGRKIKKLRAEKDWTQQDLADKTKLSVVYIGYIETALRKPTLSTLRKLAKALDVQLGEFFK